MIDEVLDLKEGDIIRLDQKVSDDLVVLINNKKKFTANPGLIENKLCIKIVDRYVPTR
ncbi:FliM/FliN family flagellar motor switch protein [bacterium]|nr:FliM/FliN family flagellar motor switch protein [bacterium]